MPEESENINTNLALVLGYLAIKDIEDLKQQVDILTRLDFNNKDIAKICGLKDSSIRSIKSRNKNNK